MATVTSLSKPFVQAEAFLHKRWKRETMRKAMRRTSLKSILFEGNSLFFVSRRQQDPPGEKPRSAKGLILYTWLAERLASGSIVEMCRGR